MMVEGIRFQNVLGNERKRARHKLRIPLHARLGGRHVVGALCVAGVAPEATELGPALLPAEEGHGIFEVAIKQRVVRDHAADGRIAHERSAVHTETESAPAAALYELQRGGGVEEARRGVEGEAQRGCELAGRLRTLDERLEYAEPDYRMEDLRINEPRAEIEEGGRAATSDESRERKARRPALKSSAR